MSPKELRSRKKKPMHSVLDPDGLPGTRRMMSKTETHQPAETKRRPRSGRVVTTVPWLVPPPSPRCRRTTCRRAGSCCRAWWWLAPRLCWVPSGDLAAFREQGPQSMDLSPLPCPHLPPLGNDTVISDPGHRKPPGHRLPECVLC